MVKRKITYRLYPNEMQANRLYEVLAVHQRIYNEALEARIRAYREEKRSLSYAAQCKSLTQWRRQNPVLAEVNAQSLQVTLKRLDLAFQAFYRRVRLGQQPGFPRFKAIQRFPGWGYKTHGDGFRLIEGKNSQHGRIRISGIGNIRIRGKGRNQGEIKTCEILHKAEKWYASVTIECSPRRVCGKKTVGLDWGVEKFLVLHNKEETIPIDNPRHLKKALPKLKELQRSISRKTNKKSSNRKKAIKKLSAIHAKITNQRKDFQHQLAAKIVKGHGLIGVEELSVKVMTRSGGRRKSGLNREILSTAPRQFHSLLKSKAEEAGAIWVEIPTREVKPSQTCYQCGKQNKKPLSERIHLCDCGANCSRDENAARVILNWALSWASGQELAELGSHRCLMALNQETHAIP